MCGIRESRGLPNPGASGIVGTALKISHDRRSQVRRSPFLVDACFERHIGGITPERKNAGSAYCEQNSGDRETSVVTARKLVDIGESHRPNPAGDRDTCKNETVSSGVILQTKITRGQERQQIEFGPGGQLDQRRCQASATPFPAPFVQGALCARVGARTWPRKIPCPSSGHALGCSHGCARSSNARNLCGPGRPHRTGRTRR